MEIGFFIFLPPVLFSAFRVCCPWGDIMHEPNSKTYRRRNQREEDERPIPGEIYPVIDNDLARDNIENDLPAADLNEL